MSDIIILTLGLSEKIKTMKTWSWNNFGVGVYM